MSMGLVENEQSFDLYLLEESESYAMSAPEEDQNFDMEMEDLFVVDDVKKVRVADIVDNLTTDEPKKPLSAAQGVVLDGRIRQLGADIAEGNEETLKAANEYTEDLFKQISVPDVAGPIAEHNASADAHGDIRVMLEGLVSRLNALANSDDETLDQMAEVVAFIKDNRGLIEQITTGKVSVADIVNNLTTNISNRPLSAAQGVALKKLIDALDKELDGKIPTSARKNIVWEAVSELETLHAFRAFDSPVHFGLNNSNSLTAIVSTMPNNCDCDFWINDYTFYNVYKEISQRAKAEGATDGYGTVIIRKRNSLANVEWRHYKSMLTLGRRWTATNDKGWAGDWVVLVTADGKPQGGYTPVRGRDYWTDADKDEIVSDVKAVSAPAGFGLGVFDQSKPITKEELNSPKGNGWHFLYAPYSEWSDVFPGGGTIWGAVRIEGLNSARCRETIFDWYSGYNVTRTNSGGTWQPWEWQNPPMTVGVEYRTTERHMGKPVYAKLVDCGLSASGAMKEIPINAENLEALVRVEGRIGTSTLPFLGAPSSFNHSWNAWISTSGTNITIWSGSNMENVQCYATVYYTKTTD